MKTIVDCHARCGRCVACIEHRGMVSVRLGMQCGNALRRYQLTRDDRWMLEACGWKELANLMRDRFPSRSRVL